MTPRFIPFEAMTDAEQRRHLLMWHSCRVNGEVYIKDQAITFHAERHAEPPNHCLTPHAHDKPTCSCWPVENPWTYYGATEPGGAMEFNPDCREHDTHDKPTRRTT